MTQRGAYTIHLLTGRVGDQRHKVIAFWLVCDWCVTYQQNSKVCEVITQTGGVVNAGVVCPAATTVPATAPLCTQKHPSFTITLIILILP